MKTSLFLALLAVPVLSMSAAQADSDTFQIQVPRVQGDLACTINPTNTQDYDCSIDVKSQTTETITFKNVAQGSAPAEYAGVDTIQGTNSGSALILVANAQKQVTNVIQANADKNADGSVRLGMSIAETSSLNTVNLAPVTVQNVDSQTTKVSLSFVAYGSSSSQAVNILNHADLQNHLVSKIRPMISAYSFLH